ncbi:MAG: hypothetical protein ACRD5M_02850 [Candidatus Acidiferrales bacterium]
MNRTIELVILAVALLVAALAIHAWLAAHDDQLRLQATLASQKQLLDAADARERDRTATLNTTLAQIDALKRSTQTPAQILSELPKYISLPQPITLAPAASNPAATTGTAQQRGTDASAKSGAVASPAPENLPDAPVAQVPTADLKPLYDFVQDCRACQAQLAAAKLDAADDATKISALARERDAAVTAARGGGFWLRLRRNTRWFVIGAAAGAAALCTTGHCRA